MFPSKPLAVLALAATTLLGACTDMYLDRRDTVSFAAFHQPRCDPDGTIFLLAKRFARALVHGDLLAGMANLQWQLLPPGVLC